MSVIWWLEEKSKAKLLTLVINASISVSLLEKKGLGMC